MKEDVREISNRARSLTFLLSLMVLLFALAGCSGHSTFRKSFGEQPLWPPEQPPFKQAEERFWTQVKVRSNLAESHMKLGLHYQQRGRHDLANREFKQAIRMNGEYIEAYNGLGISLTSQGECEQAATAFRTALKLTEKPYLYNNFGCSSLICGEPGRAVELFRHAAELESDNSRIENNLRLAEMRVLLKSEAFAAGKTTGEMSPSQPPAASVADIHAAPVDPAGEPPAGREIAVLEPRPASAAAGEATEQSEPAPTPRSTDIPADIPVLAASEMKRIRIPRNGSEAPNGGIDSSWGIEVSNGNGMTGMARRSAAYFRRQGFTVERVTNADRYTVADTVIFYREGYLDAAKNLASVIPGEQQFEVANDLGREGIRIRVLLGRDLAAMKFSETAEHILKDETKGVALAAAQR